MKKNKSFVLFFSVFVEVIKRNVVFVLLIIADFVFLTFAVHNILTVVPLGLGWLWLAAVNIC